MDPLCNEKYLVQELKPSPLSTPFAEKIPFPKKCMPNGYLDTPCSPPDDPMHCDELDENEILATDHIFEQRTSRELETRTPPKRPFLARLLRILRQDVDTQSWLADLSFYLICFSAAMERFITKTDFGYQIFGLSGNLGDAITSQDGFRGSLLSTILSWAAGVLFAGQIAVYMDSKLARWWLSAIMALQWILILIAMVIPGYPLKSDMVEEGTSLIIKASLLSFAAGMTFALMKQIQIQEINAGLVTGVVGNFLCSDHVLHRSQYRSKVRYLLSLGVFVAGYYITSVMRQYPGVDAKWIWMLCLLLRASAIIVLLMVRGVKVPADPVNKPEKLIICC